MVGGDVAAGVVMFGGLGGFVVCCCCCWWARRRERRVWRGGRMSKVEAEGKGRFSVVGTWEVIIRLKTVCKSC